MTILNDLLKVDASATSHGVASVSLSGGLNDLLNENQFDMPACHGACRETAKEAT